MATTYTRRINLYINGKEVTNDIASIKAAMAKLTNEQARMTLGSKEYYAHAAKINQLRGILRQHQADINQTGKSWLSLSAIADKFNKYQSLFVGFMGSFAGIVLGVKASVQAFNDFEERVSNLSALTGLAGDDLKWLGDQAKQLSVSTLEGSILVTQSAQDIVDAFTKVGSARPELLKDKDALVEVTKNALILSSASKTELQPSIEALTMVMNQYNTSATEARRIINAIAAGSKEGAGEIPYITAAFEKAGTVAADAGISIETLVATIETLAPRITAPEIAGRTLKGVLLDLQAGADDTNPAIVGMATALENLGKKNMSVTELTKLFGTENITTAKILINNVGELKKYEAAVTGTSIAIEQATVNTDNNNARLMQAKNRIGLISMELGQKLSPAYAGIISKSTALLKGISAVVDILYKYSGTIITVTAVVISYSLAVKLAALWEARSNKEKGIGLALSKLETLVFNAKFAAIALGNTIMNLLSGNVKKAAISFRAFSVALAANPIGLIVGAVVLLGAALFKLVTRTEQVTAAQKANMDVEIQAQQSIVEQKLRVQDLLKIAASEQQSLENRKAALAELNKISPEYFGNLTLQSVKTDEARKASDLYSESLMENARVLAAQQLMVELEKKNIEDTLSGKAKELNLWEKIKAVGKVNIYSKTTMDQSLAAAAAEKAAKNQSEYNDKMKSYQEIIAKNQDPKKPKITPVTGSPETSTEPGESGSGKGKSKFDLAKEAMTEAFNEEQNLLKNQLLLRNLTQQQYDDEQYALVLAHLLAMRELYATSGQDTTDLDSQILDKKLEGQKKIDDGYALSAEISKAQTDESKKADQEQIDSMNQFQQEYEAGLDAENQAFADKQVEKQKSEEETTKAQEEARRAQIENAAQAGAAAVDEAKTLKDAARGVLQVIRDQIKARLMEAVAIQVGKVLMKVPFPFNIAAAAAAAGAVSFLFNKIVPKFEEGGYTASGPQDQPAGIVHRGEWVAPAYMVKNPQTGAIIQALENTRLNRISPNPALVAGRIPFATGGMVTSVPTVPSQETSEMNARLLAAIDRLMTWRPKVYTEDIKKGLDNLDNINKTRNL